MPYKKGPHGSVRSYSSSNGRYCNEYLNNFLNTKQYKSHEEKERARREMLKEQALNSKDKNLYTVYNMLEDICPGCVRHVNFSIYDKNIKAKREIDLITTKAIYEIKSGRAKHKFKQYLEQKALADALKKDYVVYSPDSTNYQIKTARRAGINIFNNYDEFKENERKRK